MTSEENLDWELWGTYAVSDHLRRRAFIADVLLFDRLVIPIPPPNDTKELRRWHEMGWRPERQRRLQRREALAMLKRRALAAGLPPEFSPHWCRATGITEFLERGGAVEDAQRIAFHADPRTTKLYDRRGKKIEQDEIQRLRFERGLS